MGAGQRAGKIREESGSWCVYLFIDYSVVFLFQRKAFPVSQQWEFRRSRSKTCLAVSSCHTFPAGATGVVFMKPPELMQP